MSVHEIFGVFSGSYSSEDSEHKTCRFSCSRLFPSPHLLVSPASMPRTWYTPPNNNANDRRDKQQRKLGKEVMQRREERELQDALKELGQLEQRVDEERGISNKMVGSGSVARAAEVRGWKAELEQAVKTVRSGLRNTRFEGEHLTKNAACADLKV